MTTIFGTVTAEVSEDLVHKFPNGFDLYSVLEGASKETGVMLHYSDRHYKFQGLWLSMGKVFSILATSLALYGSNSLPPTQKDIIKSEKSGAISKQENKSKKEKTKISENDPHVSEIVPQNSASTEISNSKKSNSGENSVDSLVKDNSKSQNHEGSEPNVKHSDRKFDAKYKNIQNESNGTDKRQSLKIPPRRKRGRPKKNPSTGLSLVKQKMYKFTKLKPNFVRRPLIQTPVAKVIDKKLNEEITQMDNEGKFSESSPQDDYEFENDNEDNIEINGEHLESETPEKVKKKRGRPKIQEEKTYFCSQCDFICDTSFSLADHKRKFHKSCPVKCDVCCKVFPNNRYMIRHKVSHEDPQHCCDLCGKVYKIKKSLDDHKKTHDVDYTRPVLECPHCCKTYGSRSILKCHIKSEHLGEKKSFLCSVCGKSFTTKHSLQEHSNAHSGSKPHICDVCGKGFNYESALRDHKYTHTKERRFSCVVCKKHFSQRSSLKMHMRIHAVEKKFVCADCGRGFTQKQALQRHERVHKGVKPFVCKFCRRTFTDSSIIRRHLILVHKIHKDSNCWREDIICKIAPTNFRVEKVDDPVKETEREIVLEESEIIPALSVYNSDQKNNFNLKPEYSALDSHGTQIPVYTSASPNQIAPINTGVMATQAIDYSDRNTNNHVNSTKDERLQVETDFNPPLSNSWQDRISCDPTQNLTENLIPSNLSHPGLTGIHLDSSSQTKDYHPHPHPHLHRSMTPQYLPTIDLDNNVRCSSVNYPVDIRPDLSTDQSSTSTQWPSIYAYYSQLASQFGMSFNDYQQATGYGISTQDPPPEHQHNHT